MLIERIGVSRKEPTEAFPICRIPTDSMVAEMIDERNVSSNGRRFLYWEFLQTLRADHESSSHTLSLRGIRRNSCQYAVAFARY